MTDLDSDQEWAIQTLDEVGVVKLGHFIGTAGPHLDAYVAKDVPTRFPVRLRGLIRRINDKIGRLGDAGTVDVVVAAPMGALAGGVMLAEELRVEYVYLEEEGTGKDKKLVIKRAPFIEAVQGKRVGIFEDIVNTGETTEATIAAVEAAGGTVVWVACLWSRDGRTAESFGIPFFVPLVNKLLRKWADYQACKVDGPCSQGEPVRIDFGRPEKFPELAKYPGGTIDHG